MFSGFDVKVSQSGKFGNYRAAKNNAANPVAHRYLFSRVYPNLEAAGPIAGDHAHFDVARSRRNRDEGLDRRILALKEKLLAPARRRRQPFEIGALHLDILYGAGNRRSD